MMQQYRWLFWPIILTISLCLWSCDDDDEIPALDQGQTDTSPNVDAGVDAPEDDKGGADKGATDNGATDSTGDSGGTKEVIINEIAAKGNPNDWFELYNPSSNSIDLKDYYLSDDITNLKQAKFSDYVSDAGTGTTIIEGGKYMAFELDGID